MKKVTTRVLSMLLAVMMILVSSLTVPVVAAGQQTADNSNFDVMFVMDFSGSMKTSDPERCRVRAGQMFADIARTDTSRMGFVQFTNKVLAEQELQPVIDEASGEAFRNALGSLADASGQDVDTDIACGLTRALQLMESGGSFNGDRNPAIVLLSDGNTDLYPNKGQRSNDESAAELQQTVQALADKGAKIYSVGLNYDGKLDTALMNDIASKTGGSYYDIKNATEFNSAMNNIFGDLSGNPGEHLNSWYENGRYYTRFTIDSNNILQANIVILTSKGVSDPQIEDPYGKTVTNDPNKVLITKDQGGATGGVSAYTVMKVLRPDQGEWTVSVAGNADDAIDITLLTTKDVAFTLEVDGTPESKKPFKVKAFMADQDGANLKDGELLKNAAVELTIKNDQDQVVAGYDKAIMTYDANDVSYVADVTLPFGKYSASVEMTTTDQNTGETFVRTSNVVVIGVGRTPMVMKDPNEEVKASLWTAPIDTTETFNLKDLITAESLDGLTVKVLQRDDSNDNIIDVTYDETTKDFTINPVKTGNLTEKIQVSDPAYEESVVIDIQVKVRPVWPIILIICVLIVAIIVVIILVKRAKRPVLKGAVTVELVLPPMFAKLTTSPQTINMPGKSYKIDLASLIQGDPMALASYQESIARTGIIEILKKIEFTPGKNGVTNMRILPKVPGKIYINNQPVNNAKGISCQLNKNLQHVIQYSTDGTNSTTIKLSMNESGKSPWGGGMDVGNSFGGDNFGDDTFSGNTFGGAPFGGGSGMGNAPFGGDNGNFGGAPFGGSSSQGGFGGSGFGDSQSGGNSGGFGGNSFGGSQSGNSGQGGFGGNGFGSPQPGNGGQGGDSFSNQGGFGGSSSQGNSFNFGDDDDKTMPGGFF